MVPFDKEATCNSPMVGKRETDNCVFDNFCIARHSNGQRIRFGFS